MSMVRELANPEEYLVTDLQPRFAERPLHHGLLFVERDGDGAELFARFDKGHITDYVFLHPDGSQERAIVQRRIQRNRALNAQALALADPVYICRQQGDIIVWKRVPCPDDAPPIGGPIT
jgi:hypothetical protein